MISKKMCMLGSFSVGKTSLVQQYTYSVFSDRYLSTVGVKISKKVVDIDNQKLNLILWDIEGQDDYSSITSVYLRGCMGALLVVDGTRRETLDIALSLRQTMLDLLGPIPHLLLINKADIADTWEISDQDLLPLAEQGITVLKTSAKLNLNVNEAFTLLSRKMLEAG